MRQAPVPLGFLGLGTCTLDVNILATFSIGINSAGLGRMTLTTTTKTALIGVRLATQCAVFDLGTATPTKVVISNGLETRIGGLAQ